MFDVTNNSGRAARLLALLLAAVCLLAAPAAPRPAEAAAPESKPWIYNQFPVHLGFQMYWWDGFTSADPDPSVTGYDVEYRERGATSWISHPHSGTVRAVEISNLSAGQPYQVRVRATNSDGAGPWSDVENVAALVGYPTIPNAPFPLLVEAGDAQASVTWGRPSHTGGQALTGYVVRLYLEDAPTALRSIKVSGATATSVLISGLTNGTAYEVDVQATHGEGDSSGWATGRERFTPSAQLPRTAAVLVSNIGQTPSAAFDNFGTDGAVTMQGFTTGSHAAGYTLKSIETVIEAANISTAQRNTIRAELWSAASGGGPDWKVAELTVPARVSAGTAAFAAPENTVLAASTEYFFVLYTTGGFDVEIDITESNDEDAGSQAGWSISDTHWHAAQNTPSGATWTEETTASDANSYRLRVRGEEAPVQSSDASLSNLTASSATGATGPFSPLTLTPATFDPATTGYTATVANTITHARLTPTANHTSATIQVGKNGRLAQVNSGSASVAIALDVGANRIIVRVTAQDSTTKDYTVTITRLALQVGDWTSTLNVRKAGGNNLGCRNNVSGAGCNSEDVLTEDEFTYTRNIYGEPYVWTFQVRELYRTSNGSRNQLVLVANASFIQPDGRPLPNRLLTNPFFRGFVLTVLDPRNGNTTPARFSFNKADWQGNTARWEYDGTPWFPYPQYEDVSTTVTLGLERPRATLDSVYIHFDGDPPVDDFFHYDIALPARWGGLRVNIPGEYVSRDPDHEDPVQVTHAKLKVYGAHPGSAVRVGKVTYSETDQTDAQANPPVVCPQVTVRVRSVDQDGNTMIRSRSYYRCVALAAVAAGELSHAIELNAHSPTTLVDIEVTDGGVKNTYLLNIDPPPRTYRLNPRARVMEGQDALLTLTLTQPAPAGGLGFAVTAAYGTAGSEDVGEIASPVTVPQGSSALEIAVPTVDDDHDEADESFTVTVAPTGSGWAVDPEGTDTATVTIVDNDDPPPEQRDQSSQAKYADLITRVKEWRNDPCCVHDKAHTDRWDRALLAFGETVADTTLAVMTASEAQGYADRGWTRWVEVAAALREPENRAPTVASAIADATIVNESGSKQVALSGVFGDADNDALAITAASSDEAVATVSVASDGSSLTVSAQARGTATITVTADDGRGGTVSDTFTVTVKAAPVVASAIGNLSLEEGSFHEISLSGVFSDADGDSLTVTAATSDNAVAAVAVAADQAKLTVAGIAEGTATVTVTARDSDGNRVSDAFDATVAAPPPQETPNQAPTVSSAIGNATIVNESGTHQVSLSGVFSDADGDSLTIAAASSDEAVATVSVASDHSALTVSAQSRGTVTITVTASDGRGGTVADAFTVTVKAAPVVASPPADISGMTVEANREVSLSGVFSDADGDALTFTAASSDEGVVAAFVFSGTLTIVAVTDGSVTITVTAKDADGNLVSDTFDVSVVGEPASVENLRCVAKTDRVAFLWDAPEWSGGETYAYDYELTLPDGRNEGGRLFGITLLLRPGEYQQGAEASVSVEAVYETPDGAEVSSAEATLTCTVE